jgi:uncharacterized membrane protein
MVVSFARQTTHALTNRRPVAGITEAKKTGRIWRRNVPTRYCMPVAVISVTLFQESVRISHPRRVPRNTKAVRNVSSRLDKRRCHRGFQASKDLSGSQNRGPMSAMMSDPTTTDPMPAPGADVANLESFLDDAVPRRSWAAWGGFVLSLVLLAPWVALMFNKLQGQTGFITGALVGLAGGLFAMILGIIGIFRTRKRRRRGRAVAIAAIPLGLAGGFMQLAVGFLGHHVTAVRAEGDVAVQILKASSEDVAVQAAEWRTEVGSARFQANVTPEQMTGWLRAVLAEHGQLQSASMSPQGAFQSERNATKYRVIGQFVNGSSPIEMIMGYENNSLKPRVDDIRVDGSSPRDWKPADAP